MHKRWQFLTPLLVLAATAVHADTRGVTLQEAITRALAHNRQLKANQLSRDAAMEEIAISSSRYLPRVAFEETFAAANAPSRVFMMKLDQGRIAATDFAPDAMNNPAATRDFRTALTLEQPLFDAGISRGAAVAREAAEAATWQLARHRDETAFLAYAAYLQVQRASQHLVVADRAVLAAREHERLAQVRSAAGVGLKADELRARSFRSEMEQLRISASNNLELARLELARLMGEPPGTTLDIATPLAARPMAQDDSELESQALVLRQDLQAMEHQVNQASGEVRRARGSYLPTIYGTAGYELHDRSTPLGRDNDGWYMGAQLRWELFDGMRRPHAVEQASLKQQAAEARLADFRAAVAYQVRESRLRRDEAAKRLEIARLDVQAAEEGTRLVQRRYESSLSLLIELLDAQTNLNRSQVQLVEQEANYLLANARLLHSAGLFLKEYAP